MIQVSAPPLDDDARLAIADAAIRERLEAACRLPRAKLRAVVRNIARQFGVGVRQLMMLAEYKGWLPTRRGR